MFTGDPCRFINTGGSDGFSTFGLVRLQWMSCSAQRRGVTGRTFMKRQRNNDNVCDVLQRYIPGYGRRPAERQFQAMPELS